MRALAVALLALALPARECEPGAVDPLRAWLDTLRFSVPDQSFLVLDGAFNLVVLAAQFFRLDGDPLLLHLDELIESVGLGVLGQIDQHGLGERLKVVLNSVLHYVVDVDNQLLKFGETLVHVIQVPVNVH